MQRVSDALILSASPQGESAFLVRLFSKDYGKVSGLVRGGRKQKSFLQPMARVSFTHTRRLSGQLGSLKVEPLMASPAECFMCATRLKALHYLAEILDKTMEEDEPHEALYQETLDVLKALDGAELWEKIAHYELSLLSELGYGLSLKVEEAVPCDQGTPLMWVSPKSGRAVPQAIGEAYAERLLPLPALFGGPAQEKKQDVQTAFRLTGYFLDQATHHRKLTARQALLQDV